MKRAIAGVVAVFVFLFLFGGCDQLPDYIPLVDEVKAAFTAIMNAIEEVYESVLEETDYVEVDRDADHVVTITFKNYEVDDVEFNDGLTTVTLNGTVVSDPATNTFTVDMDCESNDFAGKLTVELEFIHDPFDPESDYEVTLLKVNGVVFDIDALDN